MYHVLLVDDEPWVLEGLRTMIGWEEHGFRICGEALSGHEALQLVRHHQPELVVTDIRMPVLSGLELMEQANRLLEKPPKFVILSGYDDFEYARTAMRQRAAGYLLKPVDEEEMGALLAGIFRQIRNEDQAGLRYEKQQHAAVNHTINRLIQGEYTDKLAARARSLLQLEGCERMRCLITESVFEPAQFQQICRRYCTKREGACFRDGSGRNAILFMGADHEAHGEQLQETIHAIYRDLCGIAERPVIVCVSREAAGIRFVRELYLQAAELAESKRAQGKSGVFFDCGHSPSEKRRSLHPDQFKQLLEKVRAGVAEEIQACVKHIFASFISERQDIEIVKAQAADMEMTLYRSILEINGQTGIFAKELGESFGAMDGIHDYSQLEHYVENLCLQAARNLRELELRNEDNTIFHVIQYVDREFRSKLQLQDLAKHFHLNSAYLGQLFKKNTGKSFNEYLNHRRIEEAKRLLKQSSLRIAEVAVRVGFPNTDYFITRFKKQTGILPSVYQKDGSRAGTNGEETLC
ncbi:response regulator transcription factor [Paenibacillus sp. SAF-054]|uniref:response regulator transcription factor n=1 Tax=unclassified Paenibacillus TaxID=185978 RepID=UPI003F7D3C98